MIWYILYNKFFALVMYFNFLQHILSELIAFLKPKKLLYK